MHASLVAHVDLTVDATELARTRAELVDVLRSWGIGLVDDAVVVLSELMGNAVRYGGRLVGVSLDRTADGVLISVADESPALPVPRTPDDDDEHGRGLQLVSAYSTAWGAEPRDAGKRVWALVPLG